ncbi:hypothetical protein ACFWMS_25365 [Peribacillus butanolivorans]|uniref:hypothetical protein n=1 Tax=Peribacillus butanolivorans TaxID=421767 RepID=UPI0036631DB2
MKFYRVTADFDMSAHGNLEVKEFLNLDNALIEAAYQVNDFINCIPYNGELDQEDTDWEASEHEIFRFYGVSRTGEDIVTVRVTEGTFEDVSEEKATMNITLHTYVDQLINNEDGINDKFGSAWFTVPRNWAEKLVALQGFDSLEHFLKEYTYDNTIDWILEAVEEGVLIGTGTGDMGDY